MNKSLLHLTASPHIHSIHSTRGVMLDVILALLPATLAGVFIFGLRALLVIAVTVGSAVLAEFLFNLAIKKERTIGDLSAIVTGLLLALNLPANIPLWQAVVGAVFAIVVVKGCFGGIGKNIVNPAIAARIFMLIAFGSMASAAMPVNWKAILTAPQTVLDTVAGATPLSMLGENAEPPSLLNLFLGNHGGAIGETCVLALIIGGIYLLCRKVIMWHLPVSFIGTVFVFTFVLTALEQKEAIANVLNGDATLSFAALGTVLLPILVETLTWTFSGGLFIGAIYMATDYVTSPATWSGQILFGVGCGLLTVVIRSFGSYPEGVSFAILLMNILTPYIDIWTARKPFGGAAR